MYELLGERHFDAAAVAPAQARSFVASKLLGLTADDLATILLATSELATNAVEHTGGDFDLRVLRDDHSVRIEVADLSPHAPVLKPNSTHRTGGRGMLIIQRVASAWGVADSASGQGKIVWCSIPTGV